MAQILNDRMIDVWQNGRRVGTLVPEAPKKREHTVE